MPAEAPSVCEDLLIVDAEILLARISVRSLLKEDGVEETKPLNLPLYKGVPKKPVLRSLSFRSRKFEAESASRIHVCVLDAQNPGKIIPPLQTAR